MNQSDSIKAARRLATEIGVDDEQAIDTLASDDLFAAYAYIYEQADIYLDEVESTMAGAEMKSTARRCAADARDVATIRAEELLGRQLDQPHETYRGP